MQKSPVRRFFLALATIFASLLLLALFTVQTYYLGALTGSASAVGAQTNGPAKPEARTDATVRAEYCSEALATSRLGDQSGLTSTSLSFKDSWFDEDSHVYQHDLATSCAVLSAVCNSESQFYSKVKGARPYAEQALGSLGFADVRTKSYALRSSLLDELGALLTGTHDVAAYTFASKTIPGAGGDASTTLVFVGIRGSYGVEWISNFNFAGNPKDSVDHQGFRAAEIEIQHSLTKYLHNIGADPRHTSILLTGHSRGGAIANLLAARLDDLSGTDGQLAPASGVYAYTFATPGVTRKADRHGPEYSNIFNVVNEADVVPQLLSIWGYERYGTTVSLPGVSSANFGSSYRAMRETFLGNTGVAPDVNEGSVAALDSFNRRMTGDFASSSSRLTPQEALSTMHALIGVNVGAALVSHFPDTYIAWMQSVPAGLLSFDGPSPLG